MDIAHQFKQIRISIAQDRFVTALKQVADLAMAPVVSLGVAELDPLHDLGKRHAFGFEQQMDVVGHQDVGEQAKSITLAIVLQTFQVGDAVLVVMKSSLLLIAANNHMVERSVLLDSGLSCHGAKTSRSEDIKSIFNCLDWSNNKPRREIPT